LYGKRD